MKRRLALAIAAGIALLATGCGSSPTAAPVFDKSPNATPPVVARKDPPKPAAAPVTTSPAPVTTASPPVAATPAPAKPADAEPGPVIKPAPKPDPVIAQSIDEPQARPYKEGDWRPEFHVVKKGDTLYSIALDYGEDYKDLAAWNNLDDPGVIKIDQKLRLFPPESASGVPVSAPTAAAASTAPSAAQVPVKSEPRGRKLPYSEQALAQLKMPPAAPPPVSNPPAAAPPPAAGSNLPAASVTGTKPPAPKPVAATSKPPAADAKMTWEWPAHGKVSYAFGQGSNQKGVGIDGKMGEAVLASAPGKVVYSGSGLRGYGKLVIIKHNATFLSVYAHNSQILVKEGQSVAKGQKIAEMGDTDASRVGLHFEIRRQGKPTDPLQYLPERAS